MASRAVSFHFSPRRPLGRPGFVATALGIGDAADRSVPIDECVRTVRRALEAGLNLIDTTGYSRPLEERPRGKFRSGGKAADGEPLLPRLWLSFPNEQDAAFEAALSFTPLSPEPAGAAGRMP